MKLTILFLTTIALLLNGCGTGASTNAGSAKTTGSANTSTSNTTTSSVNSGPNAVQIIFSTGNSGSFNTTSIPASGGTYVNAVRVFDLNGNQISNFATDYPNWWFESAGVFLTSTSTSYPGGGSGATTGNLTYPERTPCAYFDTYNGDNNPESNGAFTIDGLIPNATSLSATTPSADIDQCAGITASEKSKMGIYFKLRRSTSTSMDSTDKIQMIIKAKPLTPPNTGPVPSSCMNAGLFDATACATTVFTLSMRTAIAAATKPFFMLMPSAKSLDLVSESVIMPINIDSSITTLTIDRLKGGAIFYSVILVRVP